MGPLLGLLAPLLASGGSQVAGGLLGSLPKLAGTLGPVAARTPTMADPSLWQRFRAIQFAAQQRNGGQDGQMLAQMMQSPQWLQPIPQMNFGMGQRVGERPY